MCKIIILDFASCEVHIFNYDNNVYEDAIEFLSKNYDNQGNPFKEANCQWMITEEEQKLDIVIH